MKLIGVPPSHSREGAAWPKHPAGDPWHPRDFVVFLNRVLGDIASVARRRASSVRRRAPPPPQQQDIVRGCLVPLMPALADTQRSSWVPSIAGGEPSSTRRWFSANRHAVTYKYAWLFKHPTPCPRADGVMQPSSRRDVAL